MSFQQFPWRYVVDLSRAYGIPLVQVTAHEHGNGMTAVDIKGRVYVIGQHPDGRAAIEHVPHERTTTSERIASGVLGDDKWGQELRRRIAELR